MQPTRPRTKKRFLIAALIVALIAAIYFGRGLFGGGEPPPGSFGVPVETVVVTAAPMDVTIDAVGTLAANEMVTLRPEIAGKITSVQFTEGTPVKKGEPLFKIDDRMARAELKQAESSLQLARLNYNRFQKLSSTGAATKQRYDEARAELGVSQANADLARTKVDYMTIKAPFDGVVGLRKVSPGEYVEVGQELANFVSYDPMKVDFTIPETQASQLAVNQTIDMTVEALPGRTFKGIVYALDPQLDIQGRAVSLRATIPNPDNVLKPGFFARIALTVAHKENAMLIPESAIVPQGDLKQVFVVDTASKAQLVPVELGERTAGKVEILSGLKPGDVIVTSGQIKLQPGAPVMDLRTAKPPGAAVSAATEEPVPVPEATPAVPVEPAAAPVDPLAVEPLETVPASEEPLPEATEPDSPASEMP